METSDLIKRYGNINKILCPSGFFVMIREQDGNDDGILSNVSLNKESSAINTFIQDIVVWAENGQSPDGRLTSDQVLELRLKDKYFILMSSRIFSLGPILKFQYDWGGDQEQVPYEEDLMNFIWDYSRPFPDPESKDYPFKAIKPYNEPISVTHIKRTLSTGKVVQFKYMDGYSEQYLIKLPEFKVDVNSRLVARDLQLQINEEWVKVENFKVFKSREMMELRNMIEEVDEQFDGVIDLVNPYNQDTVKQFLIRIPDFFYPREI